MPPCKAIDNRNRQTGEDEEGSEKVKLLTNRERETFRLVNISDRTHLGCIRVNYGGKLKEDSLHEAIKIGLAVEFNKMGIAYITEAKLSNGELRIDILCLNGDVYEIKVSECIESLQKKYNICKELGLNMHIVIPDKKAHYKIFKAEDYLKEVK